MSKIAQISRELSIMEQGKFQLACLAYLELQGIGEVHSPGAVDGSEKTKKGHPDVFIRLHDGTYILAECTTKDSTSSAAFNKKLEKDLRECLDYKKLGLSSDLVHAVYLFCNSSVTPDVYEHLNTIAKKSDVILKVIGQRDLAMFFCREGKLFAKQNMGIAFETGQVLTKAEFLRQYQKKSISTGLENQIVGRECELEELSEMLKNEDLIIVNGPAGVGKSRLVMEAVDAFVKSNCEFCPYYIFAKSGDITEDLITFLNAGKSYILFIDDANNQLENLKRILDLVLERDGGLKLIMTVREYARNEIFRQCKDFNTNNFVLRKLSNEVIGEIISSEPFSIRDKTIINRITKISDGNPRLAIMAANIIKENPDINLLGDVTGVYDRYFSNILQDNEIFGRRHTKQVLGIIAFFYSIDISVPHECDLISSFGLDVAEFFECALELERLEIVEIFENSVVKISEQVIATYFFYDSFFRDPVLSFRSLLTNCYGDHIYRLKSQVLPVLNTFGAEHVINRKHTDWQNFWEEIKNDRETAKSFMRDFGRYFPNQFFSWISSIKSDNALVDGNYFYYDSLVKRHNNYHHDEILDLLEPFYDGAFENFKTAVLLSFKYAGGRPETLAILIDKLRISLYLNSAEISEGLPHINFIYDLLIKMAKSAIQYKYALYLIFDDVVLRFSRRSELFDKVGDRYILKDVLRELRKRILHDYFNDFDVERPFIRAMLLGYLREKQGLWSTEIEADFPSISLIIEKLMHPSNFAECYFVNRYVDMVGERSSAFQAELNFYKKKFQGSIYVLYSLLSMKYDLTDERSTWEDFQMKKAKIISEKIQVNSIEDFIDIHSKLEEIIDFRGIMSGAADGVNILLRNIFSANFKLGMQCLEYYLQNGDIAFINAPAIILTIHNKGGKESDQLYAIINQSDFVCKRDWLNKFFLYLPEDLISDKKIDDLLRFYQSYQGALELSSDDYNQYDSYRQGTKVQIMKAVYNNRKNNQEFIYTLPLNFFRKNPEMLISDLELCQKIFFQREEVPRNYRIDEGEFILFVERDISFFDRYIDWLFHPDRDLRIVSRKVLSGIWVLPEAASLIHRFLQRVVKEPFSQRTSLASIFFTSMPEEHREKAFSVLKQIVMDFSDNSFVLNIVLDLARNNLNRFYLTLIQYIIIQNDDIGLFNKLQLYNNHFESSGGKKWSQFKMEKLKEIIDAVVEMTEDYKYFEHKSYLGI